MALFDALLEFSDNQEMAQSAATYAATNTFNWKDEDLEMGQGEPIWFNVRIGTEAIAATDGSTAGACTLVVDLVSEANTTIDSGSEIMYRSRTFTEDEMTEKAWLVRIPLPVDIDNQQYLGVLYTIAGDTSAVGKIDTWLDHGPQSSHDTQVADSNI
ncbi:hypothetical protein LCGC14_0434550 [marine sediment metagenome]|uniref:Uncharacterized protein n=1 Tax=marine sediment metagenome TaxID=412755 RepID=A0A0F9SM94_9ZZZZ